MEPNMLNEMYPSETFERFIEATTMKNVITLHKRLLDYADLRPCDFNTFFPRYKRAVTSNHQKKNWKAKALFSKIEKRANHKCYSNTKVATTATPIGNRTSDNAQAPSDTQVPEDSLPSQSSNTRTHSNYNNNNALHNYKCLIIGSGPAGLRTAIELQLLGAERVVVVEKRSRFSRNNVLHLWPFVIDDLKSLGAKKFYGKFCAGSIDHISIRQLQLILLKVCLMIGCDFRDSCSYISLCPSSIKQPIAKLDSVEKQEEADEQTKCGYAKCKEFVSNQPNSLGDCKPDRESQSSKCDTQTSPTSESLEENDQSTELTSNRLRGARAHFESDHVQNEDDLHSLNWDIIIGADGRRNTLRSFFPRKEFRGRLAIAITANFINRQTPAEACVPEISGLSFIYNQDMFNALAYDTNIQLENICYYKDDTHYFVMTAKKKSLLERGVLISDFATTQDLLSDKNVNKEALLKYAKDAAYWTTGLEPLDFALNHYGQEDCAMFDFTSMYAASNACKALRTRDQGLALVSLVGDSLLEPFWPTGSGCARGFLSSFDAAWLCRQWAVNKCAVLDYHGSIASRLSRNRNTSLSQTTKPLVATTYDKMALGVIAERESIYRILAQTTSENLQQNYSHWTLNPHTRYPNLNRHLLLPSQVEHLIDDASKPAVVDKNLLSPGSQHVRRVKSPNQSKNRRSPKKLKSAGASPSAQTKNPKNHRAKSMPKTSQRSQSRHDISYADYYLELEESYRNLADGERGGMTQYLNYKRRDSTDLDDLFIPSISGTLPSSNNLSKLEARKARDIDECLRQRRQKTKITIVRDQLISQMRGEDKRDKDGQPLFKGGNAVLFNEIKRMREQQAKGGARGESKPRDAASGPLSLLNSMRRCASFAERVKSFENKLSNPSADSCDSTTSTPRTPIDNVKNLPQFATLQELIVNSAQKSDDQTGKSRIPVAKLAKDDWNVKCWENRFGAVGQKHLSTSSRSLNKAISVDTGCDRFSRNNKPKKQVDVFQDRINQMANKLKTVTDKQSTHRTPSSNGPRNDAQTTAAGCQPVRSQGWVNHLKRELAKGSELAKRTINGQPMNPALPNKPIKKLFPDEDEDDDGIDVNKHYDHLCVNRPTNKYLAKGGGYKSHLARNKVTSKVIDRSKLNAENKQAQIAALTSRGSSASSTLSDYSTNTGHSSSASGGKQAPSVRGPVMDVGCIRCRKFVSTTDRITIGASLLHRVCLLCANCGITLRSNEIQHYIETVTEMRAKDRHLPIEQEIKFACAICAPGIRVALSREAGAKLVETREDSEGEIKNPLPYQRRMQSREEFLNSRINYSELYKNILDRTNEKPREESKIDRKDDDNSDSAPVRQKQSEGSHEARPAHVTSSPVQVTIPMNFVRDGASINNGTEDEKFSIAVSRTAIDGSEQVTLVLPSESATVTPSNAEPDDTQCGNAGAIVNPHRRERKEMIDEEELQRILHLGKHQTRRKSSSSSSSSSSSCSSSVKAEGSSSSGTEGEADEDDADSSSLDQSCNTASAKRTAEHSSQGRVRADTSSTAAAAAGAITSDDDDDNGEDSSSLDLPPDSDEYDDDNEEDEENIEMNSTCDDFITTEEFEAAGSDREDENTLSEVSSGRRASNGPQEHCNKTVAAAADMPAS